MQTIRSKYHVVLAVFPGTKGLGYALFEGQRAIVDWGIKQNKSNRNARSIKQLRTLLGWFRPDVVVLENVDAEGTRKSRRVRKLIERMKELLGEMGIRLVTYTRKQMQWCFARYEAVTKYEMALAIAEELPELKPRVPRKRKPWMPEPYSMMMFDAIALAFAHYCFEEAKQ